jgi:hypothetical protein
MKKMTKAQLFKNIIKEAVREVIQEEVREIIREELEQSKTVIMEEYPVAQRQQQQVVNPKRTSYDEFLPGYNKVKQAKQLIKQQQQQIINSKPKTVIDQLLEETKSKMNTQDFQNCSDIGNVEQAMVPTGAFQQLGGIDTSMLSPEMAASIGEIEEWEPQANNMPAFPGFK